MVNKIDNKQDVKSMKIEKRVKTRIRILSTDIELKRRKRRKVRMIHRSNKSSVLKKCVPNFFKVYDGDGNVIAEVNFNDIRLK